MGIYLIIFLGIGLFIGFLKYYIKPYFKGVIGEQAVAALLNG